MGFTHYMETKKEITQKKWDAEVKPGIGMILRVAQKPPFRIPLANGEGEVNTTPEFGDDRIMFNGVGDDLYETMVIQRCVKDFYFCKTEHMPYDAAVVAVLIFMETCFRTQFRWNSDGDHYEDPEEFKQEGLRILKVTFDYELLDRKSLMRGIKEFLEQEAPAMQGNPTA